MPARPPRTWALSASRDSSAAFQEIEEVADGRRPPTQASRRSEADIASSSAGSIYLQSKWPYLHVKTSDTCRRSVAKHSALGAKVSLDLPIGEWRVYTSASARGFSDGRAWDLPRSSISIQLRLPSTAA